MLKNVTDIKIGRHYTNLGPTDLLIMFYYVGDFKKSRSKNNTMNYQ